MNRKGTFSDRAVDTLHARVAGQPARRSRMGQLPRLAALSSFSCEGPPDPLEVSAVHFARTARQTATRAARGAPDTGSTIQFG